MFRTSLSDLVLPLSKKINRKKEAKCCQSMNDLDVVLWVVLHKIPEFSFRRVVVKSTFSGRFLVTGGKRKPTNNVKI